MPGRRPQINVPIDAVLMDVAVQLAVRDQSSVGAVLRPVIEGHLRRQLKNDENLRAAVEAIERSRQASKRRRDRSLGHAEVTPLAGRPPQRKPERKRRAHSPPAG